MKKYLFLILVLFPMFLASCSSDKNDSVKPNNEISLQVKFHFTPYNVSDNSAKKVYTKELYLFYLEGKHVKEPITPYATDIAKYGNVCAIRDVNNEYIFADYASEFLQLKDNNGYYTYNFISSPIENYNFLGKQSIQQGAHLIVIKVDGTYFCKKVNITPQNGTILYDFNLVQTGKGNNVDKFIWF